MVDNCLFYNKKKKAVGTLVKSSPAPHTDLPSTVKTWWPSCICSSLWYDAVRFQHRVPLQPSASGPAQRLEVRNGPQSARVWRFASLLCDLSVHHFAIIRELHIAFHPGFNLLTGETGAGKSILVGALNLILGGRASQEMIQTGASEASVEALFDIGGQFAIQSCLRQTDLLSGDELVIRRSVSRGGRNRVLVNGQMISVQELQQIGGMLVSISGQHEHQRLLDPAMQLDLLDASGDLEPLRREVSNHYESFVRASEQLHKLQKAREERAGQLELMAFQLQELQAARLQPSEDDDLEQELNLLKHAATLAEATHQAHELLYGKRGSVLDELARVQGELETLSRIDVAQQGLLQQLEQGRLHLQELAHALQQYGRQVHFDPQRLAAVEDRLAAIQRLSRKYGGRVSDLLERIARTQTELAQGESFAEEQARLEGERHEIRHRYLTNAMELSRKRRALAAQVADDIQKALSSLDMPKARFTIRFDPENLEQPMDSLSLAAHGLDQVEFLLSANPGEEVKPLAKVASGGELSRILLALKSLLSLKGQAETLVFDEVDAGIGGRTAELVGLQLQRLATRHQVICITHLPQIASYAKHHYRVTKDVGSTETTARIETLSTDERVEELARMLGGLSISAKTRAHALEMLNRSQGLSH
ncbi:MAG TPA: DNA repair protein RecN [Syntrophobacteraceae bacterium]|nr:DNA repair protein RecN [Syntrophobacteraceae bacterium]